MPSSAGPNTAGESNLVFAYDTGDIINSYKGEPTTNQYTNSDFANGTTGWTFGSWDDGRYTYSVENILGPFGKVVPALKITRTTSDTSYADFHQGNGGKYTSGNTYTLSAYVKGSGTFYKNTQSGFSGNTGTVTLTDTWQRVDYTVLSSTNSNYPYWAATAITQNVPMYFVFAQSEQKPHVTPYTFSSRSVTQGLVSLLTPNAIDLTDVSFDSAAQITYDGTNDKIHGINSIVSYLSSSAIEFVVTPTVVNKRMTVGGYRQNDGYSQPTIGMVYIQDDNTFNAQVITATQVYRGVTSTTTIAANRTYHVVFNKDTSAGVMQLYVNGVLEASQTFDAATYGQWTTAGSYIGSNILDLGKSYNTNAGQGWSGDYLAGKIPVFKLYSRTLSSSEVAQNYQAYKSRFNLT